MVFNFGLYSVTLLVFFFHILVFSGLSLLLGLTQQIKSATWLSMILLLIALYISPFMFGYAGWYGLDGYRETLFYLPLQQVLLIGPVFLFYLKHLLYIDYAWSKKDRLHFLPGGVYLLYSFLIFIFDNLVFEEIYFYQDGRDKDFDEWYQIAGFISLLSYFLLSLKLYQDYRKKIFDNLSYAEEVTYSWVCYFLWIFLLILVLRGLFFIINPEWDKFGRKFWYYLSISLVGYFLSIQGYKQSLLLGASFLLRNPTHKSIQTKSSAINTSEEITLSENSTFDFTALLKDIEQKMIGEQLYQNPTLTLSDLAQHFDTTSRNISQAVNKGTGLNFNDYVNRFRVEAFLKEIETGLHQQHTLLGIAISCGFNSKSTFNRAFKKQTGLSPNEYVQQSTKKSFKS